MPQINQSKQNDNIDLNKAYEFKVNIIDSRYYNENNSYGVYEFSTEILDLPYTKESNFNKGNYLGILTGQMQELEIGMEYKVKAKLKFNPKYKDYSYNPSIVISEKPNTIEKQKKFLETLCTATQSKALLSKYPNIVEDIMNNVEIDLSEVKGIKEKTFDKIKDKVIDNYIIQDILILLKPLGVTFNMIKKLVNFESNPILLKNKILNNPYILTRIHGLGFKKVDGIALKIKPEIRISKERTIAYLKYKLREIGQSDGHTWISKKQLLAMVRKDIRECLDIYKQFIIDEEEKHSLLYLEDDKIGLMEYHNISKNILEQLYYLDNLPSMFEKFSEEDIEASILQTESELGFNLTEEQKKGIYSVNDHNVVIITAPAGAGKSTVIKGILNLMKTVKIKDNFIKSCYNQVYEEDKINPINKYEDEISLGMGEENFIQIGQCALSAKAAKRMKEVSNMPAQTIHRILGWKGEKFEHDKSYPMKYHINIIDELSMVNENILLHYINAVKPHSKLILIFDFAQLPPIGIGDFTRDILLSKKLCINKFTKVHRQGQKSGILMDANKIRVGENPLIKPDTKIVHGELKDMHYMFSNDKAKIQDIAIKTYLSAIKSLSLEDVCIITPRRKECINSANEINIKIQDILIDNSAPSLTRWKDGKKMIFKLGAKVMQKTNNYYQKVFNGDEGYITDINKDKFIVTFNLENGKRDIEYTIKQLEEIELSYAISVHAAQGSQYHTVISIFDMNSYILLNRKILYTAITRSQKRHLLLAEPKAFKACVDDANNKPRNTFLKDMIESYNKYEKMKEVI